MAAGDVLLTGTGDVILDASGNVLLDDGAGNPCCCGAAGPCNPCCTCDTRQDFLDVTLAGTSVNVGCNVGYGGSGSAEVTGDPNGGPYRCTRGPNNGDGSLSCTFYGEIPGCAIKSYHGGACAAGDESLVDDPVQITVTIGAGGAGVVVGRYGNYQLFYSDFTGASLGTGPCKTPTTTNNLFTTGPSNSTHLGWGGTATVAALPAASGVHVSPTSVTVTTTPTAITVTAPANVNWTTNTASLPAWATVCSSGGTAGDVSGCGNGTFYVKATSTTCAPRSGSTSTIACGCTDTLTVSQAATCAAAANPPCPGTYTLTITDWPFAGRGGTQTLTYISSPPGWFADTTHPNDSWGLKCNSDGLGYTLYADSTTPEASVPLIGGSGSTACCPATGTYALAGGTGIGTATLS